MVGTLPIMGNMCVNLIPSPVKGLLKSYVQTTDQGQ